MPVHKFSILMLTHNRLDAVQQCLESLDSTLGRDDVEFVLLDNASTDGTKEYLEDTLPCLRGGDRTLFLERKKNLGVAAGRAKLVEAADGDIIVFLDSDVLIRDDGWLDKLAEALEPENVGMAGPAGSYVKFGPAGEVAFLPAPAGQCDVVSGWCQAFKGEVLMAGIGLDQEYGLFWEEDSDFCMQIRECGWDVVCTGGIGVDHMPGLSGDTGQREKNLARFHEKWAGKQLIKAEGAY